MNESTPAASPTGAPLIHPRYVPLVIALAVALAAGLEVLVDELGPGLARSLCRAGQVALVAGIGAASPGLRRAGAKAVAVLLAVGALAWAAPALASPADAPLVVQLAPAPSPTPLYPPSRAECTRWDRNRRNWTAVGVVSGALATTGGLVSALGTVGEDRTARVSVAVTSAVLAAVGALAAYESGEYASIHRERCTTLAL